MDTMMMAGRITDARKGKPWKETVTVMAYKDPESDVVALEDTIATFVQPDFVTRADKEGNFAFHYIPAGKYQLVAVEDKNRNLMVDADEAVAWLDQPVATTDSVDSSRLAMMRLSEPVLSRQRVVSSTMPAKGRIVIVTSLPLRTPSVQGEQTVQHLSPTRDTLTLWCINPTCDSTVIILRDTNLNDTLRLRYSKPRRGRQGVVQPAAEPLMRSLCKGNNAYYDDLQLAFTNPIVRKAEDLRAEVTSKKDSSRTTCTVTLDSSGLRARINANLKADEDYQIRIPAAMFTDIYGNTTDTMLFSLKPKDYAILTVHIDNRTGLPLVVELLDSKDSAILSHPLTGSGTVRFDHFPGGNYRLRAVLDTDGNGQWTTGSYPLRRQPEEFIHYEKPLQLRERWEVEERWEVKR